MIPMHNLKIITHEYDKVNLGIERTEVLARALKYHPAILVFPGWNIDEGKIA